MPALHSGEHSYVDTFQTIHFGAGGHFHANPDQHEMDRTSTTVLRAYALPKTGRYQWRTTTDRRGINPLQTCVQRSVNHWANCRNLVVHRSSKFSQGCGWIPQPRLDLIQAGRRNCRAQSIHCLSQLVDLTARKTAPRQGRAGNPSHDYSRPAIDKGSDNWPGRQVWCMGGKQLQRQPLTVVLTPVPASERLGHLCRTDRNIVSGRCVTRTRNRPRTARPAPAPVRHDAGLVRQPSSRGTGTLHHAARLPPVVHGPAQCLPPRADRLP